MNEIIYFYIGRHTLRVLSRLVLPCGVLGRPAQSLLPTRDTFPQRDLLLGGEDFIWGKDMQIFTLYKSHTSLQGGWVGSFLVSLPPLKFTHYVYVTHAIVSVVVGTTRDIAWYVGS